MRVKFRFNKHAVELVFAVFIGALLNVIITISLIANQNVTLHGIGIGLSRSTVIYGVLFAIGLITLVSDQLKWIRTILLIVIAFMNWHLLFNLFYLLFDPRIQENGIAILQDAFLIWLQNIIVYALWYWFIDRGGPLKREHPGDSKSDFSFPQQQTQYPGWENWKPRFMDYVYLSYTNSISFAPADTVPLSRKAKYFMMAQAGISLIIIGMVVSRGITLIH